jgi:FKBP-type peptidyl-prolyl cis-trans isomerase (trigger factor)
MPNDDRYFDPMKELEKLSQERHARELDEQIKESGRKKALKHLAEVSDADLRAELVRRGL